MDVIVQAEEGQGCGAMALAGSGSALAALDPHEVSSEAFAIWAAEAQVYGAGQGGGAASAIRAGATRAGPVPPRRRASREHDLQSLLRTNHLLALLPFLERWGQ